MMQSTTPSSRTLGRTYTPYVFVVPAMAYLALFMFWPLARLAWMSLTNVKLTNPQGGHFIGLRNYAGLLLDPAFAITLKVTVIYAAATVLIGVTLGVVAALAIDRPFPGRLAVRTMLMFGWAVPSVAAALIWQWMYNERSGVLNRVASALGGGPVPWLSDQVLALPSLIAVNVWQTTPFVMLVVLAALQAVPTELREAARIDGAGRLAVFRAVTWPYIAPTVRLSALLVAIWSIRRYDVIYLLTGGGPLNSTSTLVVELRQVGFQGYDLGGASAYGVIGLLLALVVAGLHALIEHRHRKAAEA